MQLKSKFSLPHLFPTVAISNTAQCGAPWGIVFLARQ
jgi:hypothetical protein